MKIPKFSKGFTIAELLVVIVVIAILATIVVVTYDRVQLGVRDSSLSSDIDAVEGAMNNYALKNNGIYTSNLNWDSSEGPSTVIPTTPSDGNIIVVNVAGDRYCIRAYNPQSSTKTIDTAQQKGPCKLGWKSIFSDNTYHSCAIASDSNAYCWGLGTDGRLGNGSTANALVPTAVVRSGALAGKTIKTISMGGSYVCAIASDDNAYCWGNGSDGKLGNNSTSSSSVPVAVTRTGALSGLTIKKLFASDTRTCAIASNDRVYCWGLGTDGRLGNNSTASSSVPVAVSTSGGLSGKIVTDLFHGDDHTCALTSVGLVYCWGDGAQGKLGNNQSNDSSTPVAITTTGALSGKTVKKISGGALYGCAIASDNFAYCWGDGAAGVLGYGSSTSSSVPVTVSRAGVLANKALRDFVSGPFKMCVIAHDNTLYCWGNGDQGRLGNGSTNTSNVPVAVDMTGVLAGKMIRSISAGLYRACAVAIDDNVYCWGEGSHGKLGNNSTANALTPVATTTSDVFKPASAKIIAVGKEHSCAIDYKNDMYCWGYNNAGQVGNNSTADALTPALVIAPSM